MESALKRVDLPRIKSRFDAFWRREVPGEPLVAVWCPRQDAPPARFPVPETLEGRWTDIPYRVNRARHQVQSTTCLGDALPMHMPNLGPDSFAAYLGGELAFLDEGTSWVRPFVDDLSEFEPRLDRTNRWWRHMQELMDAVCEAAEGSFLVGIPDMHGGGDALAAARHPDRLALDLYDEPDELGRLMRALTDIYKGVYEEYHAATSRVQEGTITWLPAYSRGRFTALQNDFSGLVSPDMFAEFFLPEVQELTAWLDNSIYHLDGPSALGNLPLLLEVEELDGIQWVPGAGAKPMREWLDVCRQVLERGKCLQIGCPAGGVQYMLSHLPHEGLFITTYCASEAEGKALLEEARR
jgi:5-methyltetrahydrofolate--homocysteine methyltransferase